MNFGKGLNVHENFNAAESKEKRFRFPIMKDQQELSGFTQIPNRFILMLPLLRLTAAEMGMIFVLYRLILGYGKKSKEVPQVTLMKHLAVSERTVKRSLKKLHQLGVITYHDGAVTLHDVDKWDIDSQFTNKIS